jgi:hypothetical protein
MNGKQTSPKDGAERSKDYRDRQRALGRSPRLHYLTDAEQEQVKALLRKLRASEP